MKDLFEGSPPFFLDQVAVPREAGVLVLAPHPDDFDAVGITLRRLQKNGNSIRLVVVSSGAGGVEDGFCATADPRDKAAAREREQIESCAFFGLAGERVSFLRLKEDGAGHPIDSAENQALIRGEMERERNDLVFLPHHNDTNPGHRRTYAMFRRILEETGSDKIVFLASDPKTVEMKVDLYAVFTEEDALWKAELLRFHASQHARNLNTRNMGIDDRILGVNRRIAASLPEDVEYAEAFELELFRGGKKKDP